MLARYFETYIGKKITKKIVTGETFFTKVYQRNYVIEVIGVKKDVLYVEVTSYDVVPSGYKEGGSDKEYGGHTIRLGDKTKEEVINEIIKKVNSNFLREYKIVI